MQRHAQQILCRCHIFIDFSGCCSIMRSPLHPSGAQQKYLNILFLITDRSIVWTASAVDLKRSRESWPIPRNAPRSASETPVAPTTRRPALTPCFATTAKTPRSATACVRTAGTTSKSRSSKRIGRSISHHPPSALLTTIPKHPFGSWFLMPWGTAKAPTASPHFERRGFRVWNARPVLGLYWRSM